MGFNISGAAGVKAVWHIYQRAHKGFVVFYTMRDCLAFFSIFSVVAERHKIKVLGLCLMYNHIHILAEFEGRVAVSSFMHDLMTSFVNTYNKRYGLSGILFDKHGCALKSGSKRIRTALAYLYNNPVEDRLCERAEQWRWNFLSYSSTRFPFSKPFALRNCPKRLRSAAEQVNALRRSGTPVGYPVLDRLFMKLDFQEKMQLVDHIISSYSIIEFKGAAAYYGSVQNMLTAFASNTGSEYDIAEKLDGRPGAEFKKMIRYIAGDKLSSGILAMTEDERRSQLEELVCVCGVKRANAKKILHI